MELCFSTLTTLPLRHSTVVRLASRNRYRLTTRIRPQTRSVATAPGNEKDVASPPTTAAATTPLSPRWRVRKVHEDTTAIGKTLVVKGWVRTVRDQKKFAFIDLNDGSSLAGLQVVVDGDHPAYDVVSTLTTGCSIAATGEIIPSQGKGQSVEMKATDLRLIGVADSTFPLQKKRHSLEFLREIAHLRPRTNSTGAMARVRSVLASATHEFFSQNGFVYLNSPIITTADTEGAGELFRVTRSIPPSGKASEIPLMKDNEEAEAVDFSKDFFGKAAFLTVSGQLSAEAYALALGDVYTFGPVFRAENSNTPRHLAEFWMIEPEMAFATLEDDMENAEAYIKFTISKALERCDKDLEFFGKFVEKGLVDKLRAVCAEPFEKISYSDAVELLEKANKPNKKGKKRFEFDIFWGADLQTEHERYLTEEHFKKPVFVYDYPASIKAFYMRQNDHDSGKTVAAMDLLVPGIGELIGGSAREERLDVLEDKMEASGLVVKDYQWYLDLRKYGSVPHAGYGLGFERLVRFVTGLENIRDTIPFPRYPGNAQF